MLTLAKVAAASESLSFSAYPQIIFFPRAAASATVCLGGTEGAEWEGVKPGDGRGEEPGLGEGEGTSMALWLVKPRHIVFASRAEKVFD